MTARRSPPKTPLWLLRLLGANPVREAMIGDILERFVQGRSRLWFWKEIAAALRAEMPSSEVSAQLAELRRLTDREQEKRHRARRLGTMQFLQEELKRAEARYTAEPTEERRQTRDLLRQNLEKARRQFEK